MTQPSLILLVTMQHHPAGGHLQYVGSIMTEANAITNLGHGGQVLMSLQSRQSLSARMSSALVRPWYAVLLATFIVMVGRLSGH